MAEVASRQTRWPPREASRCVRRVGRVATAIKIRAFISLQWSHQLLHAMLISSKTTVCLCHERSTRHDMETNGSPSHVGWCRMGGFAGEQGDICTGPRPSQRCRPLHHDGRGQSPHFLGRRHPRTTATQHTSPSPRSVGSHGLFLSDKRVVTIPHRVSSKAFHAKQSAGPVSAQRTPAAVLVHGGRAGERGRRTR